MLTLFITIHGYFIHDYLSTSIFNNDISPEDLLRVIKSTILTNLTIEI